MQKLNQIKSQRESDDFDDFAGKYRQIHDKNIKISGANSDYFSRMKIELLKGYEKNERLKVLDLGCGDGNSTKFMNEIFFRWQIAGLDISYKSIKVAKEKKLNQVYFQVFDGKYIPFENNTFDVIFIAGVLHHIPFDKHALLLGEVQRVCKNQGRVYIFEHNPRNPFTKYLVHTCMFDRHVRLLKASYLKGILLNNDFHIADKRFIIFFPRYKFLKFLLPLENYLGKCPIGGQYFFQVINNNAKSL